ncbi:MAG: hypothetical protein AMJ46_13475 [Latescibacteria bacterium DG_63]|nr:MAG: hypothetical protein AMJ46_13475 [Latescibacteria bacterium DG_63]
MREIVKHNAGRIYLGVLFATVVAMLYVTRYFTRGILVGGIVPLPFFSGVCFLLIWLIAYLIYFFKYWPYR